MTREQVFWGWGEPGAGPSMPAHAIPFLREQLGVSGAVVDRPVALAEVRLREPALDGALIDRLRAIAEVRDDRSIRILRCRGKSYTDLLAQRAGDCESAPDAVVAPRSHDEVLRVLDACAEAGVAVVPFGGGTSVVGGLECDRPSVSLDLGRMDRVLAVDTTSGTATLEPGLRLPEAERALAAHGVTLGHVPQSFEWATVGGCVATRSAGQSSSGHGRIDANMIALKAATPAGTLETVAVPASAAGPDLRQLLAGSEGAFGVITEATLRVRPRIPSSSYRAWFARSFEEGVDALRALVELDATPDIARLSDEEETRVALALAAGGRAGRAYLRARLGADAPGCLLILGWEGPRGGPRLIPGLVAAGSRPGSAWARARFDGPHLRDDLLDRGVLTETLETATTWANLTELRDTVRRALRDALRTAVVGCHVSHVYATGASLYFTVLAPREADGAAQWRRAKAAAMGAIVASRSTITHHHAVGRDHAPWLEAEDGALGLEALRAVKRRLDPAEVMNPGVLLSAQQDDL